MDYMRLHTDLLDRRQREQSNLLKDEIDVAHHKIINRNGLDSEYLGWLDVMPKNLTRDISTHAKDLAGDIDVLVVIGIGGSYLGCRGIYELLKKQGRPELIFLGYHMGSDEIQDVIDSLHGKEVATVVISKSGTTLEPAISFRILKKYLKERYDDSQLKKRIITITDPTDGALRKMTEQKGYASYEIPRGVGGRYSVLSPVGLFPLAVAGVDIGALVDTARACFASYEDKIPEDMYGYVGWRQSQYRQGKKIEIFSNFSPKAHYLGEWWKQLFGESEGKDGMGLYPDTLDFSTDLHSLGQYIQDGERLFIQTCVKFKKNTRSPIKIEEDIDNFDGLNYLKGKTLSDINNVALDATMRAHNNGGTPCVICELEGKDENSIGEFISFMMYSCALSGYVLGINPFDQPGVGAYKTKMFTMLGKPNH